MLVGSLFEFFGVGAENGEDFFNKTKNTKEKKCTRKLIYCRSPAWQNSPPIPFFFSLSILPFKDEINTANIIL